MRQGWLERGAGATRRALARVAYHTGLLRVVAAAIDGLTLERTSHFPHVRRSGHHGLAILTFHRVAPRPDDYLEPMPLSLFESQMRFLAERCNVLPLEQAVEALRRDELPARSVVVTFDDGYRDNYEHAFPVLRRLGLTATFFLITGAVGSDRLVWHDRVFRAFRRTRVAGLRGFGLSDERPPTPTARDTVLAYLKRLPVDRRDEEIGLLVERLGVDDRRKGDGLMLRWDEVREMQPAGMSFGAHTVTHPVLSLLPVERVREELLESKRTIERELGREVPAFAYPNGRGSDFDEGTKRVLRECGFACAVTTIHGMNRSGADATPDPFELRRIGMGEVPVELFASKLTAYRMEGAEA